MKKGEATDHGCVADETEPFSNYAETYWTNSSTASPPELLMTRAGCSDSCDHTIERTG